MTFSLSILVAILITSITLVYGSILALMSKGLEKPWYKINSYNWALVPILGIWILIFLSL